MNVLPNGKKGFKQKKNGTRVYKIIISRKYKHQIVKMQLRILNISQTTSRHKIKRSK